MFSTLINFATLQIYSTFKIHRELEHSLKLYFSWSNKNFLFDNFQKYHKTLALLTADNTEKERQKTFLS